MKKDLLFIIPSLGIGGGEKSLINLLEQIDYTKYNVDLFVLSGQGIFLDFIPKEIKIINSPNDLKIFQLPLVESITKFMTMKKTVMIYHRIMFFIKNKFRKSVSKGEQYSWKHLKQAIGIIEKKYDVAIGYLEKTSNYVCVDCVQAEKKIGWVHTDYRKLNVNECFDESYFSKLNYIITVSEECALILKKQFSNLDDCIYVINNIVTERTIKKLSQEDIHISIKDDEFLIISIGRLSYEKGFDIAVKACKILKQKGLKIKWIVIGEGEERNRLQKLINENQLNCEFILVGADANPYKYLSKADLYVQPSRFEGKSIAIEEAKILNIPIIVTNYTTVKDQINNRFNGIITEMNELDLSVGIEELIVNRQLYLTIKKNLIKLKVGNEEEIHKLYKIID